MSRLSPEQPDRRRRRRRRAEVVNMPPPWRRSLVESGMSKRLSRADKVVVALFPVMVVLLLAGLLLLSG